MNQLTQEQLNEMKSLATGIISAYGRRDELFKRYKEIYFMENSIKPRGLDLGDEDIKTTISPSGRNDVTGLKRILDTGDIQIKVKNKQNTPKADAIEAGLKDMLRVSNERGISRVEKDQNLAAILFGMSALTVESVDDLITAKTKDMDGNEKENVNKFVVQQLTELRKRTPFLISTVNPEQSYPEWGEFGMVGHIRKYDVRGNVLKERWGCADPGLKFENTYTVYDFFHYEKRAVWAEGVKDVLFSGTWLDLTADEVAKLPIFVSYGGGSSLWNEPEHQLHPFLYAKAIGEWDKRENLYWTYLFTSIFMQGLPGPVLVRDPDDQSDIKVKYDGGLKIITARGKLEHVNVIDGDVLQLKNLMDGENARSTIRPEAFGGGNEGTTFSGYVQSMNASKLPSEDPKEGITKIYRDACLYILQRIKAESIENDLISPADIPDDIDIEVTLEPNLTQDDLRNAQIATNLKAANTNISSEWINTHILKIADSKEMFRQKTKEDIRQSMVQQILQNQQLMEPYISSAMGQKKPAPPPAQPTAPSQDGMTPPEATSQNGMMQEQPGEMTGMEAMPQTDAMIPQSERQ